MSVSTSNDPRLELLRRWIAEDLALPAKHMAPASADASFRRYFRVTRGKESFIVMDAPPDKEDLRQFLRVAAILADVGVHVPRVLAQDLGKGFLLLTDLGSRQYLDELKAGRGIDPLYSDALDALLKIQVGGSAAGSTLPGYGRELLLREMQLMPEWFLERHLGLTLDAAQRAMLEQLFEVLIEAAATQPVCLVHRDFHSRNLMLCPDNNPGILDFQDAVYGPYTYDLVSLLKDCYIAWPKARVRLWVAQYRERLRGAGIPAGEDGQFQRWFDLMGLQRHIKVLGIFARLWYRDGKPGYLGDLPLVLNYVRDAAGAYPETATFARFLSEQVHARFAQVQAQAPVSV
jgi:N-acetylmuramate 1-kinase